MNEKFLPRTHLQTHQFEQLIEQLHQNLDFLQDQLSTQNRDLEIAAQVSRQVASLLDLDELLLQIVELTKESFDLYHAHIYLLDDATQTLLLTAGAGDAGRQMVAKGHSISIEHPTSLVAQTARAMEGVIVNDVTDTPHFLANPLLPDTQSEMAIPMMVGEHLIGVLDVQSDVAGRFGEHDLSVITSLGEQLAIAVQNARTFQAVQDAQKEVASIFENSIDIIGTANFNGYLTRLNPAAEQILGWTRAELMARPFAEFVHPDDVEATNKEAAKIAEGATTIDFLNRYRTKDGGYRWISWRANPDFENQVMNIIGSDITERKFAEEKSARSAAQYQALVANNPDSISIVDRDYKMVFINNTDYGLTLEELIGKSVFDFIPPNSHDILKESLGKTFATGEMTSYEVRVDLPVGTFWFSSRVVPIIENGEVIQVTLVATDITERKAIEEQSARSGAQYQSLVANNPDAISIVDRDYKILFLNNPIAGLTVEEAVGQNVLNFVPAESQDLLKSSIDKTFATGEISAYELEAILPAGTFWFSSRVIPIIENGEVTQVTLISSEITERKMAAAKIQRRAAEMETLAKVAAATTQLLDIDKLLQTATDLTKENFNLYHAQVYLLDDKRENLVLAAGADKVGRELHAKGHSIPLNREHSLVATAARTRQGVMVNDVTQNPNFLANPLLPDTKAEMAIPMLIGDEVIGVLDVQAEVLNRFDDDDIQVKTTLASQLAIAVRNARAFADVRKAQKEVTSIFENSIDIIGTANFNGYFSRLNPAAEQILGWSREELMARPFAEFVHPDDVEATNKEAAKIAQGATTIDFLNRYHAKDGSYRWLSWRATPDFENQVMNLIASDVTERKEAEEALLKAQKEITSIFDNSIDIIGTADFNGYLTRLNPAAEQILGWSRAELMARPFAEFVHPDDIEATNKEAAKIAEGATTIDFLNRYRTKDGNYRWISWRANPDFENQVMNIIGSDVTERKLAEEQSARSAAQYQALVANNPDAISIVDRDYKILFLNSPVGGLSIEDTVGQNVLNFVPVESQHLLKSGIDNTFATGEISAYELEAPLPEGTFWFSSRVVPIFENDKVSQVTLISSNITERKTAEAKIQRRAAELQTVATVAASTTQMLNADQLLQSVVDLTRDSFNLYHTHIYLLDEAGENLVLSAGAGEVGRTMVAKGHSIPLSRELSLVATAARTQKAVIINDVTATPNFLPNPLLPDTQSEMAIPMLVGDQLIGVLDVQANTLNRFDEQDIQVQTTLASQVAIAVRNVRAFEFEKETAERLRDVDRLKSQFLANMSHELRTPLNSIIGYSEVLLEGIDGDLTDEATQDVKDIYQSGKHLLEIINDILDLAKIEAGQMRLEMKAVKLDAVAREVVQTAQVLIKEKPITIEFEVEGETPVIKGDAIRLRQVILNLVSNAIKFTEEGTIRIDVGMHDSKTAYVSVADTGVGMDEEDLAKIFERFSQVDGSATRRAEGTGLGLTITRELIHMHGGEIKVESEVGVGSTFWFTVPVPQE